MNQKRLKLSLLDPVKHVTPETLYAQMLKRQARRIMAAITECPPHTLPANIARLDDLRETIHHGINHGQIEALEGKVSGAQLMYPATVGDYLACLDICRKEHRSPAFMGATDAAIERIERKVDMLAGLVANNPQLVEFLTGEKEGE